MHGRAASRRLFRRRGRVTLVWGLVFFAAAQLGLVLTLLAYRPLRDPEYGRRLVALRTRLAERQPGRPVVAVLGSSRVAMGFRPGLLHTNDPAGTGPVVFNMAVCRAGPVMEALTLRRLLADGVRPDLVLAEAWPHMMATNTGEEQGIPVDRLTWHDVRTLAPYYTDPAPLRAAWVSRHRVPWHGERMHLLGQWAPQWLSAENKRKNLEWEGLDGWGWLLHPLFKTEGLDNPVGQHARFAACAKDYAACSPLYRVTDLSRRVYGEMAALCARRNIRFGLIMMPDPFLNHYFPDATLRFDREFRQLAKELNTPVVDARDWVSRSGFLEGVHLTPDGAAAFTERFERELGPQLAGASLTERWPVGRVEAPPLLHWGRGFIPEEYCDGAVVHWCGKTGEAILVNTSDRVRFCRVQFRARRPLPGPRHRLTVQTPSVTHQIWIDLGEQVFDQVIELPPGKLTLQFACDADPYRFGEGREFSFAIADPVVTESATPTKPDRAMQTSHPGPSQRRE